MSVHIASGRTAAAAFLAVGVLLLAACNAASSSGASTAGGESAGTARCSGTEGGSGDAAIELSGFAFSGEATIDAGQAVTFTNSDSAEHTITEGTNGTAVEGACVDQSISSGSSVTVTFNQAGDYDITCKLHPSMHTVIHVQ